MKKTQRLLLTTLIVCLPLQAISGLPSISDSATNEAQFVEHGQYTNKNGQKIHSPAHTKNGKIPAGATAKCGDGSYSFSKSHRGTCARHSGVSEWLE